MPLRRRASHDAARRSSSGSRTPRRSSASQASGAERVLHLLARRVFPAADLLIAPSRGAAEDLARWLDLPDSKVEVHPNPVVGPILERGRSVPVDHPWFADDGDDAAHRVVLACTRMEPHKGLLTLLARVRIRGGIAARRQAPHPR